MCARYAFRPSRRFLSLGAWMMKNGKWASYCIYCTASRSEDLTFTANASLNSESAWLRMRMDWYYPKFKEVMQRASRRILTYRASMPIDEIVLNLEYFQHYYFITNHNHITKTCFPKMLPMFPRFSCWQPGQVWIPFKNWAGIIKNWRCLPYIRPI